MRWLTVSSVHCSSCSEPLVFWRSRWETRRLSYLAIVGIGLIASGIQLLRSVPPAYAVSLVFGTFICLSRSGLPMWACCLASRPLSDWERLRRALAWRRPQLAGAGTAMAARWSSRLP